MYTCLRVRESRCHGGLGWRGVLLHVHPYAGRGSATVGLNGPQLQVLLYPQPLWRCVSCLVSQSELTGLVMPTLLVAIIAYITGKEYVGWVHATKIYCIIGSGVYYSTHSCSPMLVTLHSYVATVYFEVLVSTANTLLQVLPCRRASLFYKFNASILLSVSQAFIADEEMFDGVYSEERLKRFMSGLKAEKRTSSAASATGSTNPFLSDED